MKALKIMLLIIASIALALGLALCDDDTDTGTAPTPTPPTPTPNVCDNAESAACEHDGAFCAIGQKLVDYCIFQDDEGGELLTEGEVGDIVCSLNTFWDTLVDNMTAAAGEFDAEEVSDAFDAIIADYEDLMTDLVVSLVNEGMLCEDDGEGGVAADSIAGIVDYIDELSACAECLADPENPDNWPGEVWPTIGSYAGMLGLTAEDAVTIISEAIAQLDTDLDLTGIVALIDTEGVCTFDEASITATAYNASLIAAIDFLMDNSSSGDVNTIVAGLLASEIPYLIDTVVGLLGSIHTESEDLSAISGLIPTLPSLISGLLTSEMDQCAE